MPHVTVAAIAEHNGAFLMIEEQVGGRLVINQPAGHLDDAESLVDAVIRETLEETGWHFRPEAVTGLYRWRNDDNGKTFIRVTFCGQCGRHEPERPLDDGIQRALWMSYDEITSNAKALRSPLVVRCLNDYLSGARFPLTVVQDVF